MIRAYFSEVGNINNSGKDSIEYRVASLKDLIQVVLPHLEKYPLITQKRADYLLFKQALELINAFEHLNRKGLQKIVAIRASINRGLIGDLKDSFSDVLPIKRPLVVDKEIKDPF